MHGTYGHSEARPLTDTSPSLSVPWPLASQVSTYLGQSKETRDMDGWLTTRAVVPAGEGLQASACMRPSPQRHAEGSVLEGGIWLDRSDLIPPGPQADSELLRC